MKIKRFISIIISAVLILTCMSSVAFADETISEAEITSEKCFEEESVECDEIAVSSESEEEKKEDVLLKDESETENIAIESSSEDTEEKFSVEDTEQSVENPGDESEETDTHISVKNEIDKESVEPLTDSDEVDVNSSESSINEDDELIVLAESSFSVSDALNWLESNVGTALDYDGAYGAQCVDLILYYYAYLGVTPVSGNGCDYSSNALPDGWSRVYGGVPEAGDILVYYATSSCPYGHVAIYGGNNIQYQQNFSGRMYLTKDNLSYDWCSNYWGYIRPDWNNEGTGVDQRPDSEIIAENTHPFGENGNMSWKIDSGGTDVV